MVRENAHSKPFDTEQHNEVLHHRAKTRVDPLSSLSKISSKTSRLVGFMTHKNKYSFSSHYVVLLAHINLTVL